MSENELKPCPFCGGEAVVKPDYRYQTSRYICECLSCGVENARVFDSEEDSIKAWNTRPAQREVNITEDMAIDLVRELVTAGRNERPLAPIVKRAIDEFKKLNGG